MQLNERDHKGGETNSRANDGCDIPDHVKVGYQPVHKRR
jgi:hypothetical protein